MKKATGILVIFLVATCGLSQSSGKNTLVRNNNAPWFYLGCGATVNVPFYTLKAFDANGLLTDHIDVTGPNFLFAARMAVAINPSPLIQFSLVTYPALGGAVMFDTPVIRGAYEIPVVTEVFFGKRGTGWGGFIGGGITAYGVADMPQTYPSQDSTSAYTFSPHTFGIQTSAGLQYKDALIRLSFSKGFDKPFGNVSDVSDLTKNYSFTAGISIIYQPNDWRDVFQKDLP